VSGLPLDQLHGQEVEALGLLDREDCDEVGVVERGQGFGFALEPLQAFRLRGQLRRQHLQRHVTLESEIAGAVDLAHPPGPKGPEDLVGAEACSG
jgi:hypothetical protein